MMTLQSKIENETPPIHFMLDIETLSTSLDAVIVQIGIVPFDIEADDIEDGWLIEVDPQSCLDRGLRADWETLCWWMRQSEKARAALFDGDGKDLLHALGDVRNVVLRRLGHKPDNIGGVWSHGASFDIPIIEHAFRGCGIKPPWNFRATRDTRTLAMLAPEADFPNPTIRHHALEDAKAQARWVQNMWKIIHGEC